MSLSIILIIVIALLNILAALLVFSRDSKKIENISFAGVAIGVACWAIGIAGFLYSKELSNALVWAKIYYFAPLELVFSSVILSQYFLYKIKFSKLFNIIFLLSGLSLAVLILFQKKFLIISVIQNYSIKQVILQQSDYALYSIFLLLGFLLTISITFIKLIKTKHFLFKQQAKLFLFGYTVSCFLGIIFNLILPWFGNYRYIELGPIFSTFLIFSVGYAIIKHRLFDIKLAAARSMAYALSLLSMGVVFVLLSFGLIGLIFQKDQLTYTDNRIIYTVLALVLAYIFPIPKKFFDKVTNKYLFQDSYDIQTFLDNFNKVIVSSFDLEVMLKNITDIIENNLKPSYCLFGIKEDGDRPRRIIGSKNHPEFTEEEIAFVRKLTPTMKRKVIVTDLLEDKYKDLQAVLQKNNISIIARLATSLREEGVGYIVLGPKKSGNMYNSQDIKVLDIIANELVIAIQNSLRTEEIENFNLTLQERVRTATNKLRNTNDKLRALDEAKDDFVSMASHQLRTPLTSVKGNISLVLDGDAGKITSLQRQLLEQAFTSSQRMVYLIADLLNVSRLKTGKFMIEAAPVDFPSIVEDEVNQLIDTAKSRHLVLSFRKPEHITTLMLDETKTRQVIMNFIDNAIYYTPAGGRIDVVLTETDTAVELRVIDNGIGVPSREQHHLFTKFYRAGNARKARPDGTGLGLFMAKKVIIAEGGSIIFQTQEGQGSTFGFSFPKASLSQENFKSLPSPQEQAVSTV